MQGCPPGRLQVEREVTCLRLLEVERGAVRNIAAVREIDHETKTLEQIAAQKQRQTRHRHYAEADHDGAAADDRGSRDVGLALDSAAIAEPVRVGLVGCRHEPAEARVGESLVVVFPPWSAADRVPASRIENGMGSVAHARDREHFVDVVHDFVGRTFSLMHETLPNTIVIVAVDCCACASDEVVSVLNNIRAPVAARRCALHPARAFRVADPMSKAVASITAGFLLAVCNGVGNAASAALATAALAAATTGRRRIAPSLASAARAAATTARAGALATVASTVGRITHRRQSLRRLRDRVARALQLARRLRVNRVIVLDGLCERLQLIGEQRLNFSDVDLTLIVLGFRLVGILLSWLVEVVVTRPSRLKSSRPTGRGVGASFSNNIGLTSATMSVVLLVGVNLREDPQTDVLDGAVGHALVRQDGQHALAAL